MGPRDIPWRAIRQCRIDANVLSAIDVLHHVTGMPLATPPDVLAHDVLDVMREAGWVFTPAALDSNNPLCNEPGLHVHFVWPFVHAIERVLSQRPEGHAVRECAASEAFVHFVDGLCAASGYARTAPTDATAARPVLALMPLAGADVATSTARLDGATSQTLSVSRGAHPDDRPPPPRRLSEPTIAGSMADGRSEPLALRRLVPKAEPVSESEALSIPESSGHASATTRPVDQAALDTASASAAYPGGSTADAMHDDDKGKRGTRSGRQNNGMLVRIHVPRPLSLSDSTAQADAAAKGLDPDRTDLVAQGTRKRPYSDPHSTEQTDAGLPAKRARTDPELCVTIKRRVESLSDQGETPRPPPIGKRMRAGDTFSVSTNSWIRTPLSDPTGALSFSPFFLFFLLAACRPFPVSRFVCMHWGVRGKRTGHGIATDVFPFFFPRFTCVFAVMRIVPVEKKIRKACDPHDGERPRRHDTQSVEVEEIPAVLPSDAHDKPRPKKRRQEGSGGSREKRRRRAILRAEQDGMPRNNPLGRWVAWGSTSVEPGFVRCTPDGRFASIVDMGVAMLGATRVAGDSRYAYVSKLVVEMRASGWVFETDRVPSLGRWQTTPCVAASDARLFIDALFEYIRPGAHRERARSFYMSAACKTLVSRITNLARRLKEQGIANLGVAIYVPIPSADGTDSNSDSNANSSLDTVAAATAALGADDTIVERTASNSGDDGAARLGGEMTNDKGHDDSDDGADDAARAKDETTPRLSLCVEGETKTSLGSFLSNTALYQMDQSDHSAPSSPLSSWTRVKVEPGTDASDRPRSPSLDEYTAGGGAPLLNASSTMVRATLSKQDRVPPRKGTHAYDSVQRTIPEAVDDTESSLCDASVSASSAKRPPFSQTPSLSAAASRAEFSEVGGERQVCETEIADDTDDETGQLVIDDAREQENDTVADDDATLTHAPSATDEWPTHRNSPIVNRRPLPLPDTHRDAGTEATLRHAENGDGARDDAGVPVRARAPTLAPLVSPFPSGYTTRTSLAAPPQPRHPVPSFYARCHSSSQAFAPHDSLGRRPPQSNQRPSPAAAPTTVTALTHTLVQERTAYDLAMCDRFVERATSARPLRVWSRTRGLWRLVLTIQPHARADRPWRVLRRVTTTDGDDNDDGGGTDGTDTTEIVPNTTAAEPVWIDRDKVHLMIMQSLTTPATVVSIDDECNAPGSVEQEAGDVITIADTWLFRTARRWSLRSHLSSRTFGGRSTPPGRRTPTSATTDGTTDGGEPIAVAAYVLSLLLRVAPQATHTVHAAECQRLIGVLQRLCALSTAHPVF